MDVPLIAASITCPSRLCPTRNKRAPSTAPVVFQLSSSEIASSSVMFMERGQNRQMNQRLVLPCRIYTLSPPVATNPRQAGLRVSLLRLHGESTRQRRHYAVMEQDGTGPRGLL